MRSLKILPVVQDGSSPGAEDGCEVDRRAAEISREARIAQLREAYQQGALKFDDRQVAERLVAHLKLAGGLFF